MPQQEYLKDANVMNIERPNCQYKTQKNFIETYIKRTKY